MIFNVQRFSLHDGDGIRTVVFFKGCPLRCPWCSNPESQSFAAEVLFDSARCIGCGDCAALADDGEIVWDTGPMIRRSAKGDLSKFIGVCPTEALTVIGEERDASGIVAEAARDQAFYWHNGGLTLSGGEPFAQPRLAAAVLLEAKRRGMHTGAETCLQVPWDNLEASLPVCDRFLADVKHVNPTKYRQYTGGDVGRVMDNLMRLGQAGASIVARVPVIPGFNDTEDELEAIVRYVAGLGVVTTMHMMPYHSYGEGKYRLLDREYAMAGVQSTPPERVAEQARKLDGLGLRLVVGG